MNEELPNGLNKTEFSENSVVRKKTDEEQYAHARARVAYRVSAVSIGVNLALTAFKLFAGIFARSMAMVSDAVHSASDVFSTFLVIIGVKIGGKKSDENHQYGHERFERSEEHTSELQSQR